MKGLRRWFSRCLELFGKKSLTHDFKQELESHIELHTEENIRRGLTPGEARRQAVLKLGGTAQVKNIYLDQSGIPWLETLCFDLRYACRTLTKNPSYSIFAIITFALGIGINTVIFSIANSVLFNPLPYPNPDQLVAIDETKPGFADGSISYPNFLDWQRENQTFASMAIYRGFGFALTGTGPAEWLKGAFISRNFFTVLGVNPIKGRSFSAAEELPGAGRAVQISEALWYGRFGGDPDIIGKSVTLDGNRYTIVGVIPQDFQVRIINFSEADVYLPVLQWNNPLIMDRGTGFGIHGIGRLKSGVTIAQAAADMHRVSSDLQKALPITNAGHSARVMPLKAKIVHSSEQFLYLLLSAVAFVLVLACANVASLSLARSTGRGPEFALRFALGASRIRVIRQLVIENVLLSLVAGAIGLAVAAWASLTVAKLLDFPRAREICVDLHSLTFLAVISVGVGIFSGIFPGLRAAQLSANVSASGARNTNSHRIQDLLAIVEVGLAVVLLIGTGLMIRTLLRLHEVDPGFKSQNVLTFAVEFPPPMIASSPAEIRVTFRQLDDAFRSTHGIKASSPIWGALPLSADDERAFWIEGQPKPSTRSEMSLALDYVVGADYLNLMGIQLRRGRFFNQIDDEDHPLAAVVDEVFAKQFLPGKDPVGTLIHLDGINGAVEIVGMVDHVNQWGLGSDETETVRAQIYLPWRQAPDALLKGSSSGGPWAVRYEGSLNTTVDAVRSVLQSINSDLILFGVQTMDSVVSDSLSLQQFSVGLLGGFSCLALIMAAVGVYCVVAYVVGQRTREIGIRLALGAQRTHVLRLMLWQGARLMLIGSGAGIIAALILTRFMAPLVYGISSIDPVSFIGVTALLDFIGVMSCYLPARKALRIDPLVSLRSE